MTELSSRPPRFRSGTVKTPPRRFSVLSSIGGFEVIDFDGRPIAECEFQHEADGIVSELNSAAHKGEIESAFENL